MDGKLMAIQNIKIESNMDAMSLQMNCVEKLEYADILIHAGIADILKSLGIMRTTNEQVEGQLKLFRANRKALR